MAEYTWAQISAQFEHVLSPARAVVALQDMLQQAAQVESYLGKHLPEHAKNEALLAAQRAQLAEVAQEYADLQKMIKDDKGTHKCYVNQLQTEARAIQQELAKKSKAAESEHCAVLQHIEHTTAQALEQSKAIIAEANEELAEVEAKLRGAKAALAQIKERL